VTCVVTEERFVDKIRKAVGMNRVLFGSDYPAVRGLDIRSMVAEVKGSRYLTEEEKIGNIGLNAAKLLGL